MIGSRVLTIVSFGLLAVVTALLAVMTAGVSRGWSEGVYVSAVMITMWTLLTVVATALLLHRRLYRRPVTASVHAALIVILIGGCISHFTATESRLSLRLCTPGDQSEPCEGVRLLELSMPSYAGTSAVRDYRCVISDATGTKATVSLNKPGTLAGRIFVISSCDSDGRGASFIVKDDRWGTGITYAGYIMLGLAFTAYFFLRNTRWRRALHLCRSLGKGATIVAVLTTLPASAAVSREFAEEFGSVQLYYHGRITPASTLARDFTAEISGGSAKIGNISAEDVMAGFIFDFGHWKRRPVIYVKSAALRELLGIDGRRASYEQFMAAVASGRIDLNDDELRRLYAADINRFEAVNMLVSGEALKLFPVRESTGAVRWLSPVDNIPAEVEGDRGIFIRKYLGLLNEQVQRNDTEAWGRLLESLRQYQYGEAGEGVPDAGRIKLEQFYVKMSSHRWPALVLGVAGIVLFFLSLYRRCEIAAIKVAATMFAAISFAAVSCGIVLRCIVGGHIPLSNGYETMQALAWLLLLAALIFSRRPQLQSMSLLAAAAAMGVSVLGGSGSTLTGMMPVLNSPLLSVHVMLVICSYALFMLMALTGVAGLLSDEREAMRLSAMTQAMLYPALALLSFGIFTGAVWANMSWGRYWGWDPKEVWALITLLVYSFAAHTRLLPCFDRPRFMLRFSVLAFVTVLITYFGVNFVLGGLHGYA